jgi:hypothetical protein
MSSSSRQFTFRPPERGNGHLLFVSIALGLVALYFVAGINVSDATTRVTPKNTEQAVNRTHKGDRLLMAPASRTRLLKQPYEIGLRGLLAVDAKLPEGCDPLVSPIADDRLANIASRCVS